MAASSTCPNCGEATLVNGSVTLKGTRLGLLTIGLSAQHLWWEDEQRQGRDRLLVLASQDERDALGCTSCAAVVVLPRQQGSTRI